MVWYTIVVPWYYLSPHVVVVRLADVVMVLQNLSWLYLGCGNIAMTLV